MGYSHSWRLSSSDLSCWAAIGNQLVADASRIIATAGIPLCHYTSDPKVLPLLCAGEGIEFSGIEGSLEPFILKPTFLGGSCKTDGMEYDIVVCAILIRLKLLLGKDIEIMSDGTWDEDWVDARHLYAGIWPDDELKDTIAKREITLEIGGMTPRTGS